MIDVQSNNRAIVIGAGLAALPLAPLPKDIK